MSIVIIGGHDRMVSQYGDICKTYKCKMKLFTQISSRFKNRIGCPDLVVLFTNTVSHKMVITATQQAKKMVSPLLVPILVVVQHLKKY